jgi:hypothetical protein
MDSAIKLVMAIAVVASAFLVGCTNRRSYRREECFASVKQMLGRDTSITQ